MANYDYYGHLSDAAMVALNGRKKTAKWWKMRDSMGNVEEELAESTD